MSNYVPDERIRKFWEKEVYSIFKQIVNNQYRLAAIQIRYQWCCGEIAKRYQNKLNIAMTDTAPKDEAGKNRLLPFGSRCVNGVPEVALFVPDIKIVFENFKRSNPHNFRQVFESCVVVGFLHELDHLALGIIGDVELIDGECIVWADTCEYTVRCFTEVYQEEICKSDMLYYSAWVKCGRNSQSKEWRDFIASIYGSLRRKS